MEGLKAESGLNPDSNDTTDARHSQLCHPICELLSLLLILKPDKDFDNSLHVLTTPSDAISRHGFDSALLGHLKPMPNGRSRRRKVKEFGCLTGSLRHVYAVLRVPPLSYYYIFIKYPFPVAFAFCRNHELLGGLWEVQVQQNAQG